MEVLQAVCRSREGAWIEIVLKDCRANGYIVAPVRERGLKSSYHANWWSVVCRSREGAWIEIDISITS